MHSRRAVVLLRVRRVQTWAAVDGVPQRIRASPGVHLAPQSRRVPSGNGVPRPARLQCAPKCHRARLAQPPV